MHPLVVLIAFLLFLILLAVTGCGGGELPEQESITIPAPYRS